MEVLSLYHQTKYLEIISWNLNIYLIIVCYLIVAYT